MLADYRYAVHVFGGAALHQAEDLHELLEPIGKPVGKLQLQNHLFPEHEQRVVHPRAQVPQGFRFASDRAVQRDPDRIIPRTDPGFAQVGNVGLGLGANVLRQLAEILQGDLLPRVARNQMGRFRQVSGQQPVHGIAAHSPALFADDVVHPPFDLKKNRRFRPVVIKAQPQLESVFIAVNCGSVKMQVIGIQIQAVHRVGKIGERCAVFIDFQVAADKIPHSPCHIFLDDILQLKPLLLHFIFSHNPSPGPC